MGFNCGIVGLPNVGKSTLFNALTATAAAEAANYPFCTIEPNTGRVGVPDHRLHQIAKIVGSANIIPTQLEFVDIAGLVKGANKGEGLGNQFLANIRDVEAICHVLRCFDDSDVTHVEGSVDPCRDADIIETELMLADLESLEKRRPALQKKSKSSKDPFMKAQLDLIDRIIPLLEDGRPARQLSCKDGDEILAFQQLQLLTAKPILYICNVNEEDAKTGNDWTQKVENRAQQEGARSVIISAAIESEVAQLDSEDEKQEFLESLGLEETGLTKVIREGYKLLDLKTFFTAGPKETRAWTVVNSALAPQAAGAIHTDFEKGFIRAETISFDDFLKNNGEQGAKAAGKLRLEGKDYLVKDGDILHFRFNV